MKVALAGGSVSAETDGYLFCVLQFLGQGNSICYRRSRCKVRDHPKYPVFGTSKMKRAVPAAGKTVCPSQQLTEERIEGNIARCKHAHVPVHRQKIVRGVGGQN